MSAHLPIALISDIHGCMNTLTRLLNALPKPCRLILLGDLIDRGPSSRQVVEFAMEHRIPTVAGNHEDLCLAFYNHAAHCAGEYERGIWLSNGGDKAVRGWNSWDSRALSERERLQAQGLGGRVPEEVLLWMEALPAYVLGPEDQLDANGRRLLASHTGYGLSADKGDWFRALWGRRSMGDGYWVGQAPDTGEEIDDGLFRVYGHTQAKTPFITKSEAMIDTGAAYGSRGYGVLTALIWPTKEVFAQSLDETTVARRFEVADGVLT